MSEKQLRYTRWGQVFNAALARGDEHSWAAYIADRWEARHIHLTGGTGIIKEPVRHNPSV